MLANYQPSQNSTKQNFVARLFIIVCASLFIVALPSLASADNSGQSELHPKTIMVLGDSISAGYGIQREQGWVHLLDQTLIEQELGWRAVNASISGETTGGGLARLGDLLTTHEPDVVLIELGGNDGLRGYPVKSIRANLTSMAEMVAKQGATPVVMAMRIPPNYGATYTEKFHSMYAELAQSHDVTLLPFILQDIALQEGMMQADGIHPTVEAQPLILDQVWAVLKPLLP